MKDKTMSPKERAYSWVYASRRSAYDCGTSDVILANQVSAYIEIAEREKDALKLECERLRRELDDATGVAR